MKLRRYEGPFDKFSDQDDFRMPAAQEDAGLQGLEPEERALVLADHQRIERGLYELSDPHPGPDFTALVMRRVALSRIQPVTTSDIATAVRVEILAAVAALAVLLTAGGGIGTVGVNLGNFAVSSRALAIGLGSGAAALRATAAMPLVAALLGCVVVAMMLLRRSGKPSVVEVRS